MPPHTYNRIRRESLTNKTDNQMDTKTEKKTEQDGGQMVTLPDESQGLAIHRSLGKVMKAVTAIDKSQYNEQQKFRYRGVDDIMNALHGLFADAGIVVIPRELDMQNSELPMAPDRDGRARVMHRTLIHMEFTFMSTQDGSVVTADGWGEGQDMADKGPYKAKSFALKSVLSQMFLIPTADLEPRQQEIDLSRQPGRQSYQQAPVQAPQPQQPVVIKQKGGDNRSELDQALADIASANTLQDLTRVRALWPQFLNNATFLNAGINRQAEIKRQQAS